MKVTVQLRQHTPIIQFQYEQAGASLRATELKPKIDRFVLDDLETVAPDFYKQNKLLIDANFSKAPQPAKYKIHVIANPATRSKPMKFASSFSKKERAELEASNIEPIPKAPYFGKIFAVQHTDIKLEIFSFNTQLADFIAEVLPYVLVYNNFGSRQSKGFGCFLPLNMTDNRFSEIISKKFKKYWKIDIDNKAWWKVVHQAYQLLKSGRNIPKGPPYKKSEMFLYMCRRRIRWEKRKIKREMQRNYPAEFSLLKPDTPLMRCMDCDGAEDQHFTHKYIRALLGLAEHNEYAVSDGVPNIDKIQVKIKDAGNAIERFRSPITFKVFGNKIFLLPEKIDPKMFDHSFEFILFEKYRNGNATEIGTLCTLPTPTATEFNLEDFLKQHLPNVKKITGQNWTLVS